MRMARGYGLALASVFGITVGAPVALLHVDVPATTAALTRFFDDAAAQAKQTPTPDFGDDSGRVQDHGGNASPADGADSTFGMATLHDLVTIGAPSDTSQSLSDSPTGDINNVAIYNIEDTDETVVINNAGNPGSTGNHMLNVGGDPQVINTGGNNNSATNLSDSVLCNGNFGGGNASAGDATSRAGGDGFSDASADPFGGDPRSCNNNSENRDIRK